MKVAIFGIDYSVEFVKDKKELLLNQRFCRGLTKYSEKRILLDNDLKGKDLERVIKHELSHIYLYETQISLKDTFTEEELCDFVAIYADHIMEAFIKIISKIEGERLK